ncbi:MAG: hypothetical protein ACRCX2_10300 [Paraclostridium sp.]
MRKAMTLKEYFDLVRYIDKHHSFRELEGKAIKYISHTFDTRTRTVYSVKLWGGFSEDKEFTIVNENKDRELKEWIYNWLDDKGE